MSRDDSSRQTPVATVAWLRLGLALLVLHLLVALRAWSWIDAEFADTFWLISPDLWVLLAAAALLCRRYGYRWYFGHLLVLGSLWIPLYRIPADIFPRMFGKEFILVDEVGQVEGLWIALFAGGPGGPPWWIQLIGPLAVLLVWTAMYWLWRSLGRQLAQPRGGGLVLSLAGLLLAAVMLDRGANLGVLQRCCSRSVYSSALLQTRHLFGRSAMEPRVRFVQDELAKLPQDLGGLGGADLFVVFVESYGRSLLRHPVYGAKMGEQLEAAERTLRADGHGAVSLWIDAPVTGAQSQVAHAAFLSGVPLRNYRDHSQLLGIKARMLTHMLGDQGYHCVNAQPKLEVDWPQSSSYFGFDEDLFGRHTPYRQDGGPIFHWAAAPDQYPLALAIDKYLQPGAKPLFLQLISGVSHAPFSTLPGYLDDWQRARDPRAYQLLKRHPYTFLDYHRSDGVEQAYLDTLSYTFEMLAGFVNALPRPALVLVLGDHQAPRTGAIAPDPLDYAVPFHAMSNRVELLAPLRELGATDSMVPVGERTVPMHGFLAEFLRAYRRR